MEFISVVAGGFIAMMPVGNKQVSIGHQRHHLLDGLDVGNRPHAMQHAQVIGSFETMDAYDFGFQQFLNEIVGIWIKAKNLRQVGLGCTRESQAVIFGFGVGLFMGIDIPLAESLKFDPGHKAAASDCFSVQIKNLMVDIDRRIRLDL